MSQVSKLEVIFPNFLLYFLDLLAPKTMTQADVPGVPTLREYHTEVFNYNGLASLKSSEVATKIAAALKDHYEVSSFWDDPVFQGLHEDLKPFTDEWWLAL